MSTVTEATRGPQQWLARWAGEPYAYLTTSGRRTGRPHRIEIWFAAQDGRMYLLAGGRERSDWVRNLQANAHVTVELGDETHAGAARVLQTGTVILPSRPRSSDHARRSSSPEACVRWRSLSRRRCSGGSTRSGLARVGEAPKAYAW